MSVTDEHGHWYRHSLALFQGTDTRYVSTLFQPAVDEEWRTVPRDPRRDIDPWGSVLGQIEGSRDALGEWSGDTGTQMLLLGVPCEAHSVYCLYRMPANPYLEGHGALWWICMERACLAMVAEIRDGRFL